MAAEAGGRRGCRAAQLRGSARATCCLLAVSSATPALLAMRSAAVFAPLSAARCGGMTTDLMWMSTSADFPDSGDANTATGYKLQAMA